jgi:hypothetical protein
MQAAGPKLRWANALAREVERLERDNQRLKRQLEKAARIIESKKACELLEIAPPTGPEQQGELMSQAGKTGAGGRCHGSLRGRLFSSAGCWPLPFA